MTRRILIPMLLAGGLLATASQSAFAQWGYNHHYYRPYGYYGRPVHVPPPVVVGPSVGVVVSPPVPVYVAPAPVVVAPLPPPPVVAAPAYVPSYTYGSVGPRGYGIGYATPGFGFYVRGR